MLKARLEELKQQRAEIVNQDIDAYVEAKLKEIEPQIRADAEKVKAYETKVCDIRIAAFEEAQAIVEAERNAVVEETPEEVETE